MREGKTLYQIAFFSACSCRAVSALPCQWPTNCLYSLRPTIATRPRESKPRPTRVRLPPIRAADSVRSEGAFQLPFRTCPFLVR